jgi:hypothetical protein
MHRSRYRFIDFMVCKVTYVIMLSYFFASYVFGQVTSYNFHYDGYQFSRRFSRTCADVPGVLQTFRTPNLLAVLPKKMA